MRSGRTAAQELIKQVARQAGREPGGDRAAAARPAVPAEDGACAQATGSSS